MTKQARGGRGAKVASPVTGASEGVFTRPLLVCARAGEGLARPPDRRDGFAKVAVVNIDHLVIFFIFFLSFFTITARLMIERADDGTRGGLGV